MPIDAIHTFLVHPNRGVTDPIPVIGNSVPLEGQIYRLLAKIYEDAERECRIGIAFNLREDGAQVNECRSLLTDYLEDASTATGMPMAQRLTDSTTGRSGIGLLFLIRGSEGPEKKVVLSRFRANNGCWWMKHLTE